MAPPVGKQMFRMLLSIPATAAALFLGFQYLLGSKCRSRELATFPRPTVQLKAVIYEQDCGPRADTTTQVALLALAATELPDTGNVLVVTGPSARGFRGGPEVRVSWLADTLLQVQYDGWTRVLTSSDRVERVVVRQSRFD
jgi:hypothetical protein